MKKLYTSALYAFIFSIPLYAPLSSKFLLLAVFLSLFVGNQPAFLKDFFFRSWDILLYVAILIFGACYSEIFFSTLRAQENKLVFVGMAILFLRHDALDGVRHHKIFLSFCYGLFLACVLCLLNSTWVFLRTQDYHVFFFYDLTSVIKSHPTYLAYYLIAAITYGLYYLYYQEGPVKRVWVSAVIVFFFAMLLLTGAKTAYVGVLLVFSFFTLKYLTEDSRPNRRMTFLLVCGLLASVFTMNAWEYFEKEGFQNDSWERSELWWSAVKANPNPLLGVGTGDYKKVLNAYYNTHGMEQFARDSYNAHNQFVQIYLSNGLIGLLSLVILIGRPLYLSVRSQNVLGVLLLFPFIIYGVTEVFLGRYQGVVFFALLHQLLISQYYSVSTGFTLKTS